MKTFWQRVQKTEGCWLWTKARSEKGYGVVWSEGRLHNAHRLVWQMKRGPIPPGKMVLHKCDVRHCVRPAHLFLGTAKENTQDMVRKGRQISRSKFTPEQTAELFRLHATGKYKQRELAVIFGVDQSTISVRLRAKTVRDEHGRLQCWEPKAPQQEKRAA